MLCIVDTNKIQIVIYLYQFISLLQKNTFYQTYRISLKTLFPSTITISDTCTMTTPRNSLINEIILPIISASRAPTSFKCHSLSISIPHEEISGSVNTELNCEKCLVLDNKNVNIMLNVTDFLFCRTDRKLDNGTRCHLKPLTAHLEIDTCLVLNH